MEVWKLIGAICTMLMQIRNYGGSSPLALITKIGNLEVLPLHIIQLTANVAVVIMSKELNQTWRLPNHDVASQL